MRKILYLFVLVVTVGPSAVLGAENPERTALLIDHGGAEWEVTAVYAWTNPGPFIESRFRLAVVTDTFHVAIPPENLISIEKKGGDFELCRKDEARTTSVSQCLLLVAFAGPVHHVP